MTNSRSRSDIRNFLVVLGTSVFCALLLSFGFIYYYGPSGRYLAGNTLLDPAIIQNLHYQYRDAKNGKKIEFGFDHIEFSYFDPRKGRIKIAPASLSNYQKFYDLVALEKSLERVSQEIQDLFFQSQETILTIHIRDADKMENKKIFQIIQFLKDDFFRIQLQEKKEGEWAYFYQAGLYQEVTHLFNP